MNVGRDAGLQIVYQIRADLRAHNRHPSSAGCTALLLREDVILFFSKRAERERDERSWCVSRLMQLRCSLKPEEGPIKSPIKSQAWFRWAQSFAAPRALSHVIRAWLLGFRTWEFGKYCTKLYLDQESLWIPVVPSSAPFRRSL